MLHSRPFLFYRLALIHRPFTHLPQLFNVLKERGETLQHHFTVLKERTETLQHHFTRFIEGRETSFQILELNQKRVGNICNNHQYYPNFTLIIRKGSKEIKKCNLTSMMTSQTFKFEDSRNKKIYTSGEQKIFFYSNSLFHYALKVMKQKVSSKGDL